MKNVLDIVIRKWLHVSMKYRVVIKKKALKGIAKMPQEIQRRMKMLVNDLVLNGPVLTTWPNFSKLSQDEYHCHLAHKWVACWRIREGEIEIEVYYAGSSENAPY